MSFLEALFGTYRSPYSDERIFLSEEAIRRLVSRYQVRTLESSEELLIESALVHARIDGKLSLKKIDEVLRGLVSRRRISSADHRGVLKAFETYINSR